MSKGAESVLVLTPETVAGMSPAEVRRIAAMEIRHMLAEYRNAGRARSGLGALVFGLLLPHFFSSAKDIGCGFLNVAVPFLGPGHLLSGSYIMWVLQLGLCALLPFLGWPGYETLGYAIGVSYTLGVLFNLLSFFVLKKIAFVLRWLRLVSKVRRGITGVHAGAKELVRPFFAKESEYAAFCAELDIRQLQYRRLVDSLQSVAQDSR